MPELLATSEDGGGELTLADLHGMEVVGSVPIWALGGLRLHKTGWRQMQPGWVVGVYQLDISALDPAYLPVPGGPATL